MLIEKEQESEESRNLADDAGPGSTYNHLVSDDHLSERVKIIDTIVKTLESSMRRPRDIETLQKEHINFAFQILDDKISTHNEDNRAYGHPRKPDSATSLYWQSLPKAPPMEFSSSSYLIQECLHYLKEYGTPMQLLKFYTRHGLLKEAVLTLFHHGLPPSSFTTFLVDRAVSTRRMHELLQVMQELGRSQKDITRPYLEAACHWLHARQFYKWLHRLQNSSMMNDFCGAALTCEWLFVEATDFDMRIGHLEQALEHYTMALRQSLETRISRLSLREFYKGSHLSSPHAVTKMKKTIAEEKGSTLSKSLGVMFSNEMLHFRMSQIRVQLDVLQLLPLDLNHNLVLLNVGKTEIIEASDLLSVIQDDMTQHSSSPTYELLMRRCNLAGQAMLCGHSQLGTDIVHAYGLSTRVLSCLGLAIYNMARYPGWSLAKSLTMASDTNRRVSRASRLELSSLQFDAKKAYSEALEKLSMLCTDKDWNVVMTQVIQRIKSERKWWSIHCTQSRLQEMHSELIHVFGVALGRDTWKIVQLLAYTGQFRKAVEFSQSKLLGNLSEDLLQFLLTEAKYATRAKILSEANVVQICQAALQALGSD